VYHRFTMNKAHAYDVPGLRAGIRISRLLCESPKPLGLAELCQSSGLSKHMVYRCLQTLLSEGIIVETGESRSTNRPVVVPLQFAARGAHDGTRARRSPLHALWEDSTNASIWACCATTACSI
jgi:DNA-binding IclR family transcriptional regulator